MIILIIYPFLRIIMSSCRPTGTITLNYSRPFITTDKILISIHRITMIIWIVKIIRIAGIILTKRFSEITKRIFLRPMRILLKTFLAKSFLKKSEILRKIFKLSRNKVLHTSRYQNKNGAERIDSQRRKSVH